MLLPEWILRDPSERSAGPPARVCENPAELFAHQRDHLLIGSCLRSRCLPSGSKSLFPPHFFHFDHDRVVAVTPSVLSENVASQTRRSPAPTRRCASRSVSTTLTAWPGNTARRTFADRDAEATPIAPSARSTLRQNHQRIVDAFFGINLTLGLFQICADGPLGSTRECEEGCNFNNDCPIEQVTNYHHHRQDCRKNAKKMPR